jgi:hypothetical protein
MRLREKRGEGVMLVLMGAMIVGGIIVWLVTGDFHMMPRHGNRDSHMNADAVSSTDDSHGNEPDPGIDQRGPDPEHVIEAEPTLDNP